MIKIERKRKKRLLVIDWDETISNHQMNLCQETANRLATKLKMLKRYCTIVIVSLATKSWIKANIESSQSTLLKHVLKDVLIITEDSRHPHDQNRIWPLINKERGESKRAMDAMILSVTKDENNLIEDTYRYAYKKTNSLIRLSAEYGVPHDEVYFLDNNKENIDFARASGFHAFLVNNDPSVIHSSMEYYLDELLLKFQSRSRSSSTHQRSKQI